MESSNWKLESRKLKRSLALVGIAHLVDELARLLQPRGPEVYVTA